MNPLELLIIAAAHKLVLDYEYAVAEHRTPDAAFRDYLESVMIVMRYVR